MIGFGVYAGQSANVQELNNTVHAVGRFAYSFEIGKKNFEVGLQGYTVAKNMNVMVGVTPFTKLNLVWSGSPCPVLN